MKRFLVVAGLAVAGLVVVLVIVWAYMGLTGPTRLENWIGRQVVGVLENYITPKVTFTSVDYRAPKTVVVEGLTLRSAGATIVELDRMLLELAEVPRRGRPIKVQRIIVTRPHLLFRTAERGFVGWSDFVKSRPLKDPESVPEGQRFSDVLVLRHVEIRDGELVYEEQGRPDERMTLPGIDMTLDTPPIESEPGLYALKGTLQRLPVFDLKLDAQVNLDTLLLMLNQIRMDVTLNDEGREALPPALQRLLRRYQVRGELAAEVSGQVPLETPGAAAGHVHLELSDGRVAFREVVLPIGGITVDGTLPDGDVKVQIVDVALHSEGDRVFSLERLVLTLAGLPVDGRPLDVQSLEVTKPFVAFLRSAGGGWKGWSVLANAGAAPGDVAPDAGTEPAELPVVYLRDVQVTGAGFAFNAAPGAEPLELSGVDLALESGPVDGQPDSYSLTGDIRMPPLVEGGVQAVLHTGEQVLDLERVALRADLRPETYGQIPEPLREQLRKHNVQAQLDFTGKLRLPLNEPQQATGSLRAALADIRYEWGQSAIVLGEAVLEAELPLENATLDVQRLALQAGQNELASAKEIRARIALAEEPLQVQELVLDSPRVTFMRGADGRLVGWSALAGGEGGTAGTEGLALPAVALADVRIHDGGVTVQTSAETQPLEVDGVEATLSAVPVAGERALAIEAHVGREPLGQADFAARLDPQTMRLDVESLSAEATLNDQTDAEVPALGGLLGAYDVQGGVTVQASGTIPLDNPSAVQGELEASVSEGQIAYAGARWFARSATANVTWPEGPVQLRGEGIEMHSAGERLLAVEAVDVQLAGFPQSGEPIEVASARVVTPRVRLIEGEQGGLAGWDRLVAGSPRSSSAESEDGWPRDGGGPGLAVESESAAMLPVIRDLKVEGGEVSYESAGEEPMVLGGIEAEVSMPPGGDGPPWRGLDVRIRREPVFETSLVGRVDPRQMLVDLRGFDLELALAEDQYGSLPPQLQSHLREHGVQGRLELHFTGRIPLHRVGEASGTGRLELRNATITTGDKVWPVEAFQASAQLRDGTVQAEYEGRALAGELRGTGSVQLASPRPFEIEWQVSGVELEDTLRALQQNPPRYAGTLSSDGNARGRLEELPGSLGGGGRMAVREGRLVNLPVIEQILGLLKKASLGSQGKLDDRADVTFTLSGEGVRLERLEIVSALVLIRGGGLIGYDGSLDLVVNAGVMEKVQSRLGRVGEILGTISDRVVSYTVKGKIGSPKVGVRALGIGG